MPTLSVERDALFTSLNKAYTDKEFDELCFEFGIELDEVTSEREEATKSITSKGRLTKQELSQLSQEVIYKIDVPANRYDLLCIEGLVRSLRVFLGDSDAPTYRVLDDVGHRMVVRPAVASVRPFVVCAVLRDIMFDEARYRSFIDLQDQLHRNLCRQRTLVAIGTHDLDTVKGNPFIYDARPGEDIKFVPLTHGGDDSKDEGPTTFTGKALLEHYETDPACKHLKPYVPIIKDSPLYPVVEDSNGTVLSLPPIINGHASRITLKTTNVFIECTATDLTKANIVLDTVLCMFSGYCAKPFTVEPVQVDYLGGGDGDSVVNSYVSPELSTRSQTASVNFINSLIGINLTGEEMVSLCERVQLGPASLLNGDDEAAGPTLQVTVPPTRSDILHPVDVAEDVGIAHGYNKIERKVPNTRSVGSEQPISALSDLLRNEIAYAGYVEVLTHGLCSIKDNFTSLRRTRTSAVELSNPANVEYEVVRTSLLPGLLKTLKHNRSKSFANGVRLFEVSDIVLPDDVHECTNTIVGARNVRRVAALYSGPTTSGFEKVHGLIDRIMTLCEVKPSSSYVSNTKEDDEERYKVGREGWSYCVRELSEGRFEAGTYFPGRAAEVLLKKPAWDGEGDDGKGSRIVGTFGIIHPEVLAAFNLDHPSSCLELDLEPLL